MAPPNRILRRTQTQAPSGYILGRISPGTGPVELLNLRALQGFGLATGASSGAATTSHGFGFSITGLPSAGQVIGIGVWPAQITFTSGDSGDVVTSQVAATADAAFSMQVLVSGVWTEVGTITFSAGTKVGVVAWTGGFYQLAAGAQLRLVAPASQDATLSNIAGKVVGVEG